MSGAAITWTVIIVWVIAAPVAALALGRMIALRDRQVPRREPTRLIRPDQ